MKRDLGIERLYPLGDFKNIKFTTILRDIPEEIAQNETIVSLLFLQQAITCEIGYREYFSMVDKIAKEKIQDVMSYLQEQREQTYLQLYEEIRKAAEKIEDKESE